MFIGREKELEQLESRYRREGYECIIVYGRRRVGKTALIRKFCKGKKTIFFTGMETTARENLENLSQSIYEAKGQTGPAPVYRDFSAALEAITDMARKEKIILVIDEYPYLAGSYPGISSLLQVEIDHKWKDLDIYLILCGSSMSFMEKQVLGHESPLFGRRTGQLKLAPFTIFEARSLFPHISGEDLALYYGATGGIPFYLTKMDEKKTVEQNLADNFFDPVSYLFEEPANLLKQELRDPSTYNAVIQAIAEGNTKLSQIASKADLEVSACAGYVKNLMDLDIVKRETPLGEKNSRRSIYLLKDGLFRFWYRFIPRHYSLIQNGMGQAACRRILPALPEFMGQVFEEICLQWLWKENKENRLPLLFEQAGRWWGTDPRTRKQEEIDILAGNADKDLLLCECKWRNEDTDIDTLQTLLRRGTLFEAHSRSYILFTKRNFSERTKRKAEEIENLRLVSYKEMI